MVGPHPISSRCDTLFPYPALFRSLRRQRFEQRLPAHERGDRVGAGNAVVDRLGGVRRAQANVEGFAHLFSEGTAPVNQRRLAAGTIIETIQLDPAAAYVDRESTRLNTSH